MGLLTAYRERTRRRPDTEHNQAVIRIVIVGLILVGSLLIQGRNPGGAAGMWAINVSSTVFSVLLFLDILRNPQVSPRRRVLGALHDNLGATIWLYSAGPMGALALFVYPFVTVGNGFRFGVWYLAWSGLLGAIGIGALVALAPGWSSHAMIGWGVFLSHIMVMGYTGVLLRRLTHAQDELEKLATRDVLTGLPNRRFFMDTLSGMVAQDRGQLACLYLDLDGFKAVNDLCGHKVGDELLNTVAREVRRCVRATDLVARLGGDEFTVVLTVPVNAEHAKDVATRIIRAIEAISSVDGHAVDISVSIGISFIPDGELSRSVPSEELLKAADEAMYVAKRSGKGNYRFRDFDGRAFAPAA